MMIVLNGEPREAPTGTTVAELIAAAGIEPERRGIAVAPEVGDDPKRWLPIGLVQHLLLGVPELQPRAECVL